MAFKNPTTSLPADAITGPIHATTLDSGGGTGPRVAVDTGPTSNRVSFYAGGPDESAPGYIQADAPGGGVLPSLALVSPTTPLVTKGPSQVNLDAATVGIASDDGTDLTAFQATGKHTFVVGIAEVMRITQSDVQINKTLNIPGANAFVGDDATAATYDFISSRASARDGAPMRVRLRPFASSTLEGLSVLFQRDNGAGWANIFELTALDDGRIQFNPISTAGRLPYRVPIVAQGQFTLGANVGAGAGATQNVTFPNIFPVGSTPQVLTTTNATRLNLGVTAVSSTGATIRYDNFTTGQAATPTIYWTAILASW